MKYILNLQLFGGRGATSGLSGRTTAQDKAIMKLAKRTANLKKEQYRIIDANGNVLLEKKGDAHSVTATVGEKRQFLEGNITLHNHPDGGTFSPDDLREFGFGAKEIVVSSPEGVYRLINKKYGTKEAKNGWLPMQEQLLSSVTEQSGFELLQQARKNVSNSKTTKSINAINNKWEKIYKTKGVDEAKKYLSSVGSKLDSLQSKRKTEINNEMRRLEVTPFHEFYKANAKQYGFDYKFEKW